MTINPGDVLAVISQSGPSVTFLDAGTHDVLAVLEVPAEPHELLFDATSRRLYCTITYRSGYYHANTGRARELVVIDADARTVLDVVDLAPDHGPHGLAIDTERGLLYVSVEETTSATGGVVVLDTATLERVGRIDTMAPGPHWFVISPDGRTGYASNKEAPFVSVVDLDRREMIGKVEVPGGEGIAVSPDGATVAIAAPKVGFDAPAGVASGIRLIDTATAAVVRTLPTDLAVMPVHMTGGGTLLVGELRVGSGPSALGGHEPGRLSVYAPDTFELRGTVDVGEFPLTITSSPDGTRGYVASVIASTVTVVDLDSIAVIATVAIDRAGEPGAHGLAYIPAARQR